MESKIMRLYKPLEIKTMNYIFGKDKTNQVFNELELRCASKIDLSDKNMVDMLKRIWKYKDNKKVLENLYKQLTGGVN